jgi:hypothetical protein
MYPSLLLLLLQLTFAFSASVKDESHIVGGAVKVNQTVYNQSHRFKTTFKLISTFQLAGI